MSGAPLPIAGRTEVTLRWRPIVVSAVIAVVCVLIFHVVSVASGKLEESGGLGWDGRAYARMTTDGLATGTSNTQTRPLMPLLARIPHSLGVDVVRSFQALNYVYAFLLYFAGALLLRQAGASTRVQAVVAGNLALCIATSKMFGFYPVQIDLGALAAVTLAFYLVRAGRRRPAAGACVIAAVSREFGVAVALYGIHRAIRRREPWLSTALTFLPAIAAVVLLRVWVLSSLDAGARAPLSAGDLLENLRTWGSPAVVAIVGYFAVTLFGGISLFLVTRARWCLARMREEPELATFVLVFAGLTAVGSLDIWRYLVFVLPAALVLIGRFYQGADPETTRRLLVAMTLVTILTQRPFDAMNVERYFRDWFPLYPYFGTEGASRALLQVWAARCAAVVLFMLAAHLTLRRTWRLARSDA